MLLANTHTHTLIHSHLIHLLRSSHIYIYANTCILMFIWTTNARTQIYDIMSPDSRIYLLYGFIQVCMRVSVSEVCVCVLDCIIHADICINIPFRCNLEYRGNMRQVSVERYEPNTFVRTASGAQ